MNPLHHAGVVALSDTDDSDDADSGFKPLAKQTHSTQPQTLTFSSDGFGASAANRPSLCAAFNWAKYRDTTAAFVPCYSATCGNPFCRSKWAMKQHSILAQSFLTKPPKYFVVITFNDTPPYKLLSGWLKSLHGRMRYRDNKYESYTQVETGEQDTFHVHLLTITKLDQASTRQIIKQSIPAEHVVYLKPCENPQATARYITKDMRGHAGVRFPLSYKGRGKRITCCSKGFLASSREELWAQVKQAFTAQTPFTKNGQLKP